MQNQSFREEELKKGLFASHTNIRTTGNENGNDFRLKERTTIYKRFGKIDSTNVKIFSVVDESFEKK